MLASACFIKLNGHLSRRLMLFGHEIRMDGSMMPAEFLTQFERLEKAGRTEGRPHATMKNDLSSHNLSVSK